MNFRNATAVSPTGSVDGASTTFDGAIHEGWDIRGNANGGYLLAIAARAMQTACDRPDIATISAHFLAPGSVGPVDLETTIVKNGKRFATVTGSMRREGKPMLQAIGAFTDHTGAAQSLTRVESVAPDLPPIEECIHIKGGDGFPPEAMNRVSLHLHPEDVFWVGEPSGNLVIRGWFDLLDGEPIDSIALLLGLDIFPPTAFPGRLPVSWVPTVEMTAHVRGRPAPGPLRCQFSTRFVSGGFLEEDGEIWDSTGTLVAQSRQLALVPRQDQT